MEIEIEIKVLTKYETSSGLVKVSSQLNSCKSCGYVYELTRFSYHR